MFIGKYEQNRVLHHESLRVDYVVVGGGLSGVCSAITAARAGVKVALVQDRPVLGGNASSEVRLWALGATSHMGNNNRWSREGGVIDEILVENTFRNKEGNPVLFDMVLLDKVIAEPNITLLLNTVVYSVEKSDSKTISSVEAFNPQNGTHYTINGAFFADCSGDGIVGYLSGASYRMGAEDKTEYGELFAPDSQTYGELMGHSILFYVKDTGKPVTYVAPDFAIKNAEELVPKLQNPQYLNVDHHGCKYWWLEYGGRLDTVKDTETIKFELWKVVYGVWDYIKNSGKFPKAETLTLEWAGLFPGKRESRRFCGYYMINQHDVIEQREHYDAVAYGGWSIDLHPADGVYASGKACNQWHSKGIFQIPYRCYVTPDIDNLFLGGRIISASHVANGSTRVMCTAAHGGQAIGAAVSLCLKNNCKPADFIDSQKIKMLQAELIKNGQFIPNLAVEGIDNMLRSATISCSSELQLTELAADGTYFTLNYPMAQMLPVQSAVPKLTLSVVAKQDTTLNVELRSSAKPWNNTPDVIDEELCVSLVKGVNVVELEFNKVYDSPRYVFACFMSNQDVDVPFSSQLVSGLVSVFNTVNPAVSNYGKQTPPEDIGVEAFEFWCPGRRPEGKNLALQFSPALSGFAVENIANEYYRPFLGVNGWIASPEDASPTIEVKWAEAQKVSKLRLFFDTDFDHAMENVQMGHYDSAMPFCISAYSIYGDEGKLLACVEDNHQTVNDISLVDTYRGHGLKIVFDKAVSNVYPAFMGLIIENN